MDKQVQTALNQFEKDTTSKVIFASQIGGSVYTDRPIRDIDVFTIYEQKLTTITDNDGIRHYKYIVDNVQYDITSVSLGGFLNLIKFGSFRAYDGILKGKVLIPNDELTALVQDYVDYRKLAKVSMELFEVEYGLGIDKPDNYKDTGRVLQHLANIYWGLYNKYALPKLSNSYQLSELQILQNDVILFSSNKIDILSDYAWQIVKELFTKAKTELELVNGTISDNKLIIINFIRGKLNEIL